MTSGDRAAPPRQVTCASSPRYALFIRSTLCHLQRERNPSSISGSMNQLKIAPWSAVAIVTVACGNGSSSSELPFAGQRYRCWIRDGHVAR
jgi:hypothetical protein